MSQYPCPNCGADLTQPQAARIAHYYFGHLEKTDATEWQDPGFKQHLEAPDTYTVLCNACKRLVRTLPLPEK